MALSFFIQEGVVSTGKKTVGTLAQLFDVTKWLKFALKSLGVPYFDPCEPTCIPNYGVMATWVDSSGRPTGMVTGVLYIGYNQSTEYIEFTVDAGVHWYEIATTADIPAP